MYRVDATAGVVYGHRGAPITKRAKGYIVINTRGRTVQSAHRMVWESVHGPIPEGMQINHKNGVKHDNRIENLELVTPSGNTKHAFQMGLASAKGERNPRAKLTAADIESIRARHAAGGVSKLDLARQHGVSKTTVGDLIAGRTWIHA